MWGSRQDCPLCAEPEGQQGGRPVPHGCAAPYPCPAQPPGQRWVLRNRASVCVCTSASVSVPMYVPRCVCTCPCMCPGAYLPPRLSSESFCRHRCHVHSEQGVCVCVHVCPSAWAPCVLAADSLPSRPSHAEAAPPGAGQGFIWSLVTLVCTHPKPVCTHSPCAPRRRTQGRWMAQVAAQMECGVASERVYGVWGEEGLG